MNDDADPNREDTLFSEANRWFFRLQAEDVTAEDKRRFSEWIAADPAHAKAWDEVRTLMGALRAPAQDAYRARRQRGRSTALRRRMLSSPAPWLAGTLTVILLVAVVVQGPAFYDRWIADYSTAPGERQTVALGDGTRVELNTDTALKINMSGGARRVTVLRGEAFFEIAKDSRPFVVAVDGGETRDIGTAFDVTKGDSGATVAVETGIVDVRANAGSGVPVRVTAGQAVDYGASGVSAVRSVDLNDDLAWRRGQIVFRQQKLSEVVAQLNRYRSGRIVIINPWISDELVSGSFNIDRPDAPIEALTAVLGVNATSLTRWLVVLR